MIYILHIDTSGDNGFVAITGNGALIARAHSTDSRNYAATINIHIEQVLQEAGITIDALSSVAVCGGPGSYTGLRIGLSAAKGLCYALEKPLMEHSKLLLLMIQEYYNHLFAYDFYASILIARDQEYFISIYDNKLNAITEPCHIMEADLPVLLRSLNGRMMVTGQSNPYVEQVLKDLNAGFAANDAIDTKAWGIYALEQYNCNGFVNLANSEPFYLKQVYTHKPKTIN